MKVTRLGNELVAVNGIIQSVHEYMIQLDLVIFHRAPDLGDRVSITVGNARLDHEGNGAQLAFQMPSNEAVQFEYFMHRVWDNRDNPTVRDQLEKLKIVMELIR